MDHFRSPLFLALLASGLYSLAKITTQLEGLRCGEGLDLGLDWMRDEFCGYYFIYGRDKIIWGFVKVWDLGLDWISMSFVDIIYGRDKIIEGLIRRGASNKTVWVKSLG